MGTFEFGVGGVVSQGDGRGLAEQSETGTACDGLFLSQNGAS